MAKSTNPFRYFDSSPEVIRTVVMMYVKYPLSLRNVEDLLAERGIDICHETVRLWWNRFGPMFAAEIRRKRVQRMRSFTHWRWHLDEVYVKINGEMHYLWRAVDHEGEAGILCQQDEGQGCGPDLHEEADEAALNRAGFPGGHVEDRLHHTTKTGRARSPDHQSRRHQRRDQGPFRIRQVACITQTLAPILAASGFGLGHHDLL